MAYYTRKHWTSVSNKAVAIKRSQVHTTLHYPGFGSSSIRTAGWSLDRCFRQLRSWRNMHVGSGMYREVAYNLYALPTGDVAEGRGNRQNGANGKSSSNRAGMSIQVLIGDDEPMTEGHLKALFAALALVESWHPGITKRQYGHSHWVSTACPGPHVRAGIPYQSGSVPSDGGGSGITGNAPGLSDGLAHVDDSQRWLNELGYNAGPVDGKFGEKTRTATKAFQTDFDITPADGRPGPATRNILEAAVTKLDRIEAITTENQKRINAARDEIDWVRRVTETNQRRIDTTIDQTGPITRDGKPVSLRQEVADGKTLDLAAEARDQAILHAVQDAATNGRPVDLDAVTAAAEKGVSAALASIEADVTVTVANGDTEG